MNFSFVNPWISWKATFYNGIFNVALDQNDTIIVKIDMSNKWLQRNSLSLEYREMDTFVHPKWHFVTGLIFKNGAKQYGQNRIQNS